MRKRKPARAPEPAPTSSLEIRRTAIGGFILGVLFWLVAVQFLIGLVPNVTHDLTYPAFGIIGAWLAVSRFRKALWAACGLVVLCFLIVGYTPLVTWLMRGWVRVDALREAPAAVVLAADSELNVGIAEKGQARLLHGYEVVRQRYAPLLVVSRGGSEVSWIPAVKEQMDNLGIEVPLEPTPRVRNTRDEAVAVAQLARKRGWREVILVTHPIHMRRAAATFEKAGINVIASPSAEWRYNVENPENSASRITALREWLHEVIGCRVYRWRGWMD